MTRKLYDALKALMADHGGSRAVSPDDHRAIAARAALADWLEQGHEMTTDAVCSNAACTWGGRQSECPGGDKCPNCDSPVNLCVA